MVSVPAGASKLPLGAACLVLLGDLVSCYAQDFGPAPALLEAYLSLLSSVASLASSEPCTVIQGVHTLVTAVICGICCKLQTLQCHSKCEYIRF